MTWYGIHDDRDPLSDEAYRIKLISCALMHPCWYNGTTKICKRPDLHTKERWDKARKSADEHVAARKKLGIVEFQKELKKELADI